MRKYTLACSIFLSLFIVQNSYSQSMFIDLDDNGIGVGGSFTQNPEASMLAVTPSIALNGTFDIGFLYGNVSQNVENADDIKGKVFSPFVNLLIFRPSENTPVGLFLSGAYEKAMYDYEFHSVGWYGPTESSGEIEVMSLIYGAGVYTQYQIDNFSNLYPGLHIARVSTKTEKEDEDGYDIDTDDRNTTVVSFGLDFQRRISDNHSILFSTSVGFTSDDSPTTIAVSLGMLINLKLKR